LYLRRLRRPERLTARAISGRLGEYRHVTQEAAMSRLRFSAPSLAWLVGLWLFLLPVGILDRVLDGERIDLWTGLSAWAVAGAITVVPYGLIRRAVQRRARP
jgi:hypothetical protein